MSSMISPPPLRFYVFLSFFVSSIWVHGCRLQETGHPYKASTDRKWQLFVHSHKVKNKCLSRLKMWIKQQSSTLCCKSRGRRSSHIIIVCGWCAQGHLQTEQQICSPAFSLPIFPDPQLRAMPFGLLRPCRRTSCHPLTSIKWASHCLWTGHHLDQFTFCPSSEPLRHQSKKRRSPIIKHCTQSGIFYEVLSSPSTIIE